MIMSKFQRALGSICIQRKKYGRIEGNISEARQHINKPDLLQNKELYPLLEVRQFFYPFTN